MGVLNKFFGRFKVNQDPSVTTQVSSIIQAASGSLVLAPEGTGAIMASVPDGTVTGGSTRGIYAVDLQTGRGFSYEVASGESSFTAGFGNRASGRYSIAIGNRNEATGFSSAAIGGGNGGGGSVRAVADYAIAAGGHQNSATTQYSAVFGGQGNTASTNTYATVVGGWINVASGQYSVAGGRSNTASGDLSFAIGGRNNTTSGTAATTLGTAYSSATSYYSAVIGAYNSTAASSYSAIIGGDLGRTYLRGQVATGVRFSDGKLAQSSTVQAYNEQALSSGGTMNLSLDGTGTTNLIESPGGSFTRNVTVKWIAVCKSAGSGTTVVRETAIGTDVFMFKYNSGTITPYISTVTNVQSFAETSMTGATCSYSASSSNLIITFTAPSTANNTTFKVLAKVELTEIAV